MIHTNVDDALIFYTYCRKPRFFLVKDGINGNRDVAQTLPLDRSRKKAFGPRSFPDCPGNEHVD